MNRHYLAMIFLSAMVFNSFAAETNNLTPSILTPPAPAEPRINGPNVFCVRPGFGL